MTASNGIPAESQAVHDPGAEVLNHDIGGADQAACGRQVSRALQVKDNMLLTALQRGVGHGLPDRAARRVHVDHLRSLVSQEHRGERAGKPLAKIDHPDAVQSPSHAFSPVPVGAHSTCVPIVYQSARVA